jgi:O-antigen ligase
MDDLVPLVLVLLVLALLFTMVMFVGHVQPVKVLVAAAARNCARAGVETLAEGRGLPQALDTAVATAGVGMPGDRAISAGGLRAVAYTENVWGRGQVLVCETSYNVDVSTLPLVPLFYSGQYVPLRYRVSLTIEPYKSRWD